jgi:predicted O-methyltransferase YrrM
VTPSRSAGARSVTWSADDEFTVRGTNFAVVEFGGPRLGRGALNTLAVYKSREQVEAYVDLVSAFPASRIVELGIMAGGSTALLAQLVQPSKLVAVDIMSEAVANLESFLDAHRLRDRVRPYYGVDQADRDRLDAIVAEEFDGDPIDLVIDDASHLLDPTRASFEVLFPRLRTLGLFVIEDWAWEHAIGHKLFVAIGSELPTDHVGGHELSQAFESLGMLPEMLAPLRSGQFLSDLVVEIIVRKADGDVTIGDVAVRPFGAEIRRGPATSDDALAAAMTGAAPSRMLHIGRLDAHVTRQISRVGVQEIVVVSNEPASEGCDGLAEVTHVRRDPSVAVPSEIARDLGDARFDVVIDAASPDGARARELASALLPLIPPGRAYLVRGWPRMITPRSETENDLPWRRLPRLLLELILAVAEWNEAIEAILFDNEWLTIRRGSDELSTEDFDVRHLYRDHFGSLSRV